MSVSSSLTITSHTTFYGHVSHPRQYMGVCYSLVEHLNLITFQPLGQRSTYNTIIADPGSPYVATFQCLISFCLQPVVLQALPLLYFTFTTPNKDQEVEQLLCSLFVRVV